MQKKAVFRNGSTARFDASFTQSQIWVNSRPKTWRPPKHSAEHLPNSASPNRPHEESIVHSLSPNEVVPGRQNIASPAFPSQRSQNEDPEETSPHSASLFTLSPPALSPMSSHAHHGDTRHNATEDDASSLSSSHPALAASEGIQESCLLRYFIEELSPWVGMPTLVVYHLLTLPVRPL